MNEGMYLKKAKCPVCNTSFSSIKVKANACRVQKKDEDFCTHYVDLNPVFYEIFVCPKCAYSASENSFSDLTETEAKLLKESFAGRVVERSFCETRTLADAIDSFKLAIYTANIRKSRHSVVAGLCLKLAWLYRYAGDEKEMVFLNHALDNYREAFDKESLPIGNLDEISVIYLLGELSRRTGRLDDAVTWFSKVISNPGKKENPRIEKLTREQWSIVKEEFRKTAK